MLHFGVYFGSLNRGLSETARKKGRIARTVLRFYDLWRCGHMVKWNWNLFVSYENSWTKSELTLIVVLDSDVKIRSGFGIFQITKHSSFAFLFFLLENSFCYPFLAAFTFRNRNKVVNIFKTVRLEPRRVGQKTNSFPVSQFLCLPGQKERDWNCMIWSRDQLSVNTKWQQVFCLV